MREQAPGTPTAYRRLPDERQTAVRRCNHTSTRPYRIYTTRQTPARLQHSTPPPPQDIQQDQLSPLAVYTHKPVASPSPTSRAVTCPATRPRLHPKVGPGRPASAPIAGRLTRFPGSPLGDCRNTRNSVPHPPCPACKPPPLARRLQASLGVAPPPSWPQPSATRPPTR